MNKNIIYSLIAISIGSLLALLVLELFLQFFNPLPLSVKNDTIVLPAKRVYTFENMHIPALDDKITHTKNSLGFRGSELPTNLEDYLSIVTVGGSTTECRFLSDGLDWASLLERELQAHTNESVWINNAGLDGHSTFGHQILLDSYLAKLQPDYILYLVGVNELERGDLHNDDKALLKNNSFSIVDWLKKNSEIAILVNGLRRSLVAYQIDAGHGTLDLKQEAHITLDEANSKAIIARQYPYLVAYEKRLSTLMRATKQDEIQPVLITQPLLFGAAIDPATTINLGTIKTRFENGKTYWEVLEMYNTITRKVAKKESVPLIDLAHLLSKNSEFYYDGMHFTNEGATEISKLLAQQFERLNLIASN